ncbi:hypothetical protein [Actinoplanes teichomyceticus]|uniref:Uncharacterized protein n=1 Tax=Actinoplanes teichomyceticus TaxID=1867 RepID=A0A561VKN2_ACTTI|nr:hypothetical protein [Actinoplanes teichomyceticus]TWG12186.1 hypothetical protein FHX34_10553 [Actinoplanes teichomyceticus]GIF14119.1 hypothetical protein Ate01nite_41510 [Actinoplanes teichomyceticus]
MRTNLTRGTPVSAIAGAEVADTVLTPPDWSGAERLPLVPVLHGADSPADAPVMMRPLIDGADLPRTLAARDSTPTVGGSCPGVGQRLVAELADELAGAAPRDPSATRRYGVLP